jgi:hypothetical protein
MAYKYTIDGKVYRSETPLSDDDLEELSGGAPAAAPAAPAARPTGDYRAEAARRGFAGTLGTVAGVGQTVSDLLAQIPALDPFGLGMRAAGVTPPAPAATPSQSFTQGRAAVYDPLMRALGSTGAQPQTMGQQVVARGIESITSPESYLFPALPALQRLGTVGGAIARPVEQFLFGAGAETGGIAGEKAGEKVGAPTAGRVVGSLFGGMTTGQALGTGTKLTVDVGGKAWNAAKSKWDKIRGVTPENELLREVDNRIGNVLIAAMAADPKMVGKVEEAIKTQQSVSLKAPGAPSVQLPTSALIADNPVIVSLIQNLSSRDPQFRTQYGAQFEQAVNDLRKNQVRLFGDPTKITLEAARRSEAGQPLVAGYDLARAQQRKVRSIEEQIADAYNRQSIDPTAFGTRVEQLVAQKEKTARESTKPLYAEAFKVAADKGVELPSSAVDDIYTFVVGSQNSDIFGRFPTIYEKVKNKFRPATTEASPILTAEGVSVAPATTQFKVAGVEDLDSLKREINRELRGSRDENNVRLLTMLKEKVSGHIDELDPDFVNAYRNADKAYLERVGLPFNAETLKSVDRKKFVEQIAPALIGNRTNVDDFLRVTGTEGEQVVKDAFYDSFTKAALKDGVIDPKAANKWLTQNSPKMSPVVGLEDELRASVNDVQALRAQQARLEGQFRQVAGQQILGKEGITEPIDLVKKMYGSVDFTNKFMRQYGGNKDAVNAARAYMLDDIVAKGGNATEFLNNRDNAAIFNRVFGPGYSKKVADFAAVSNRLNRDLTQVSFRPETVPKTPVEEVVGVPLESIISRFFNPVSGARYAVTSLFSKYWATQAAKQTEEKLKNLLLNPTDFIAVAKAVEPRAKGITKDQLETLFNVGKKYGIDWVQEATMNARLGAARGAAVGMQQPIQTAPQPEETLVDMEE